MLKSSVFAFAIKSLSAILTILFSILVGRLLGIDDFGTYSIVITVVSVLVVCFQFGMQQVLTRYISRKKVTTGKFNNSLLMMAVGISSFLMVLVLPIVELVSSSFFSSLFMNEKGLTIVALIFSMVVSGLVQASLTGLNKPLIGILIFEFLSSLMKVVICLYFFVYDIQIQVSDVLNFILVSTIISLLTGWFINGLKNGSFMFKSSLVMSKVLINEGSMLLVLSSAWLVMLYSDILVLSWINSSSDVGGYTVAQRVSTVVVVLLSAVNSVISPKLSNYYHLKQMGLFADLVKGSTLLLLAVGLFIFIFGLLISKQIMSFWGDEFTAYYMALNILLLGQFINVSTGSVGTSLIMIGKSTTVSKAAAFSAVVNILMNLILIPIYGVNGAAFATAFSLSLLNLMYLYFLYKETGIASIDFSWLIKYVRNRYV